MHQESVQVVEQIDQRLVSELNRVLVDCVEGGASVGFMLPISTEKSAKFWEAVVADVRIGARILVVARDEHGVAGTVQIILDQPENQPHRADLAKMLVHRRARNRGVGAALLACAEDAAAIAGKRLLVLDTANPIAERLYTRAGWTRCGSIPGYALMPDGALCDTALYFKRIRRP